MCRASSVATPIVLGISVVFKGHWLMIFLGLFAFSFFIEIIDIYTRMKIEKFKKTFKSEKWRIGIMQRAKDYLVLGLFAVVVYAAIGSAYGPGHEHNFFCYVLSSMPLVFIVLYVIGTFSSITENDIEYYSLRGVEPRGATLFFSKILGLVDKGIKARTEKEISNFFGETSFTKNEKDGIITTKEKN